MRELMESGRVRRELDMCGQAAGLEVNSSPYSLTKTSMCVLSGPPR